MKPPMCAHHAMPLMLNGANSSLAPWITWARNQMPANTMAGIQKNRGMNRIGTSTCTQACGKRVA